jgi:hypothetical protein
MKRKRFSREGTLKGFLLLALLANLSWQPLADHFGQIELAQTGSPNTSRPNCTGADQSRPECTPATGQERERMAAESERIRQQVEAERRRSGQSAPGARTGTGNASGNASIETDTEAQAPCVDCQRRMTESERARQIEELTRRIEELRGTSVSTASHQSEEREEFRPVASQEQIARCEVDSDGDDLNDAAEFDCQIRRLQRLTGRENADQRRDVTRKIEDLYNSLRRAAKEDLLSDDEDNRRRGERLVTAMITALGRVRFDRDRVRDQMIDSLQSLKAGAEIRTAARELDEEVRELETEMRQEWREYNRLTNQFRMSCRSREGCDMELYEELSEQQAELSDLRETHWDLAERIGEERSEALETIEEHEDGMTRAERREYTAPFNRLARQMEQMVDARRLGASSQGNRTSVTGGDSVVGRDGRYDGSGAAFLEENNLPADFYDVRGGNIAMRRSNGMYQPSPVTPMGSPQNIVGQPQMQYVPQYLNPNIGPQYQGAIPVGGMQGPYLQGQAGFSGSLLPPPQIGMRQPMYGAPMPAGPMGPMGPQMGPGMMPPQGGGAIPAPRM